MLRRPHRGRHTRRRPPASLRAARDDRRPAVCRRYRPRAMENPPLPPRLRILVRHLRQSQTQNPRHRRSLQTQPTPAPRRRRHGSRPPRRTTHTPHHAQGPPVGRLDPRPDVYGMDTVVPPPQLALAHLRPRQRHRRRHTRHVHQDARRISRRPLGRRRATDVPPLRALAQRPRDHRPRMPRHRRLGRKPRSRPRQRLRHGPPLRDRLLALDTAAPPKDSSAPSAARLP